MDSANSATSSNDKISKLAPSKRDLFLATFRRNQAWSLPDSFIYYLAKNPSSSKCYQKLIKSCKYFYVKNPVLIVPRLNLEYSGNEWNTFINYNAVDLRNISSKLWITNTIVAESFGEKPDLQCFTSIVLPKIYKSDIRTITLGCQNISFDDLIWLASKCIHIQFSAVTVNNGDGSIVALERIIEALPNVKDFSYDFEGTNPKMITSNTVKEMAKIPYFKILDRFELSDVPESFDLDDFYSYIKENNKTFISLSYYDRQISDEYKQRLQEIVNEIIGAEKREYKIPSIYFPNIIYASYHMLYNLQYG